MKRGFTLIEVLIEVLIVICILGILFSIAVPIILGKGNGSPQYKSPQESIQCIGGYKFVGKTQLIDNQGHGIVCDIGPASGPPASPY
jgi:hypothetical protein